MNSEYSVPESLDLRFSNVHQRRMIAAYKELREMEAGEQPESVMRATAKRIRVMFDEVLTPISVQAKSEASPDIDWSWFETNKF